MSITPDQKKWIRIIAAVIFVDTALLTQSIHTGVNPVLLFVIEFIVISIITFSATMVIESLNFLYHAIINKKRPFKLDSILATHFVFVIIVGLGGIASVYNNMKNSEPEPPKYERLTNPN
jgi:hypothetical protein